jgi:hypothetical protein
MERRFRVRLAELLDDAHVPPTLLRGVLPRLQTFLQPFLTALQTPQQQTNAHHYVQGLLSELGSKDVESIAYLHDRQRQGLQKFMGQADWDHQPLLTELAGQVGTERGQEDGVLVFDPSAFFAGVFAQRAFGLSSSVAESPADESSFASQRGSTSLSLVPT